MDLLNVAQRHWLSRLELLAARDIAFHDRFVRHRRFLLLHERVGVALRTLLPVHHRLLRVNRLLFLCFLGPEQLLQVAHLIELGQSEDLVLLDDNLGLLHDLRQCIRRRLPLERCQPIETALE